METRGFTIPAVAAATAPVEDAVGKELLVGVGLRGWALGFAALACDARHAIVSTRRSAIVIPVEVKANPEEREALSSNHLAVGE